MHLGIDFGTTRTVVAMADRGNHPVVEFSDPDGDWHGHWPTVSALVDGQWLHGHRAVAAHREGAGLVRSVKRELGRPGLTLDSETMVDGQRVRLVDLVTGQLRALREDLAEHSTLTADDLADPVVIGIPAHAHSGQRMLTLEAFRRAGFVVAAMVNEPSAAGFEFSDRQRRQITSRRTRVLVYDLGGGTFDASLVDVHDAEHRVLASVGLDRLGGDDMDLLLAELVLRQAGVAEHELDATEQLRLLDDCRAAKESLSPQTRRLVVEVHGELVAVPVADFNTAALPLVEQTVDLLEPLVHDLDGGAGEVAGIYLVGGSSALPLVPRLLKERFGRRVFRSAQPAASIAIGLAIAADPGSELVLHDRLGRGLGVFREWERGREVSFDAVLQPGVALSEGQVVRRYRAAHSVGWYRFAEFERLDERGMPVGRLSPRGQLVFPFEATLEQVDELESVPVRRIEGEGPLVEERYAADENGILQVTITNLDTGFTRSTELS